MSSHLYAPRIVTSDVLSNSELDALFEARVPARKFASTKVDQFGEDGAGHTRADKSTAQISQIEHIA